MSFASSCTLVKQLQQKQVFIHNSINSYYRSSAFLTGWSPPSRMWQKGWDCAIIRSLS